MVEKNIKNINNIETIPLGPFRGAVKYLQRVRSLLGASIDIVSCITVSTGSVLKPAGNNVDVKV